MDNIREEYLAVSATAGADIDNCIDDAIVLALQQGVKVVLVHNEKKYTIEPNKIRNSVRNMDYNSSQLT